MSTGRWIWRGLSTSHRLSRDASVRAAAALDEARRRRPARRGVLVPGDPAPSPSLGRDYLDYRGIAGPRDLSTVAGGVLRAGRLLDLRNGGLLGEVRLPETVLNGHLLICGPPGSGKTHGLVIPWALEAAAAGIAVVLIDVKGDLADELRSVLVPGRRTSVVEWGYGSTSGVSWNPIETPGSVWVDAVTRAIVGAPDEEKVRFHYERDYRWTKALLLLAASRIDATDLPSIADVLHDRDRLRAAVARSSDAYVRRAFAGLLKVDEETYFEWIEGLVNKFLEFTAPEVRPALSGGHEGAGAPGSRVRRGGSRGGRERPRERDDLPRARTRGTHEMVQGGQILVIKAPIWGGETAARLAGVVSGVLLAYLAEKGAGTRSLFLLDEAPRLSDRIDFASATALLRSSGVCVGLICQDVSQFGREELRDPILANCETILSLRNPGHETVRFLQKKLGSRRSTSVTRSRDPHSGRASISEAFADSAVLGEREISQVPWVEYPAIILCPRITTKPIVVDLGR